MNKRKQGLAIIINLLAFIFLQAQEKKPVSLQEAIELGIKNSKQLKNSQAKIEEATAAVREAVERKLPDAKVSASYLRLNSANVDLKTQNNNGGGGTAPNISQAVYGILNASLPIYAGGRIRYGIEASKYLAEATKLDAENDKEEVIQNIVEAYVNLYKSKQTINLIKENLNQAQHRVDDLTNLEKNGLLARNDLLKAELQQSNVELALLDAENNWQLANVSMDLLLGLPEKTELIPDSTLIDQTFTLKTLDEYVQTAYTNRKDLASLDLRKKATETGAKAIKGDYYPSLAGVSYNLGSLWKTKAKVQQAEARTKQLEISESLLNDNIRLEVSKAYLNWTSNQKKIEVYAKAVEQANENYRITKNKYDNSLATTTELIDADVAQLQSRMSLIFVKADAVVLYHKLLQTAGSLE